MWLSEYEILDDARFAIQERVWRIGRGEGTDADFRAEKTSELLLHHEERVEREL